MKSIYFILVNLFISQCILSSQVQSFDFFYFVQQWLPALCDKKAACCYPTTGKPALDFGIHGLWPVYNNHTFPSNCNGNSPFDENQILDLMSDMQKDWPTLACPKNNGKKFWAHEWNKHGTCSLSMLDMHSYFQVTLALKEKVNLLQLLKNAGIRPDGGSYGMKAIKEAIKNGIGHDVVIECNNDVFGNNQLFQVYICVDKTGSDLIECPMILKRKCDENIVFADFGSDTEGSFISL
ncbi:ribonuclease 1-like [Solanum tuberosum]|uniref:ribonuclease 1-like n=1 Tax=Solanum tuberosum TaxID=4113 RepID=UPI0003D25042|nr:PREDICTED: ribonuclease 1-like [Solanum tuberosum]